MPAAARLAAARTLRTSSLGNRDDIMITHSIPATTHSPVLTTASRHFPTHQHDRMGRLRIHQPLHDRSKPGDPVRQAPRGGRPIITGVLAQIVSRTMGGKAFAIPVCLVYQVNPNGLIDQVRKYVDERETT